MEHTEYIVTVDTNARIVISPAPERGSSNLLNTLQDAVGGSIEVATTIHALDRNNDITLLCNENGKILNLPPNPLMANVVGAIVAVGQYTDGERDLCGLTDTQVASAVAAYLLAMRHKQSTPGHEGDNKGGGDAE